MHAFHVIIICGGREGTHGIKTREKGITEGGMDSTGVLVFHPVMCVPVQVDNQHLSALLSPLIGHYQFNISEVIRYTSGWVQSRPKMQSFPFPPSDSA